MHSKSSNTQETISARPFIKWAGGKSKLIEQYSAYLPRNFKNYYEPFLGGGALFFHLNPRRGILSDINSELINTYCCVRDNVEELISKLEVHQFRHCRDYYYEIRECPGKTNIEKAGSFIYLNKTCFNGLYRKGSKKDKFNVPIGNYKNPKICNSALLRAVSSILQGVEIKTRDFEEVLKDAKSSEDWVYLDPPYFPLNKTSSFTTYSGHPFRENDQIRLKNVFTELANRGVKVMLSNSECPFIRELYKEFKINSITAARSINSNGKKRGKISEILITCY